MAQTEAEPPTPPGTRNEPTGVRRTAGAGPDRLLLSWPLASAVILAGVLVLLIGGGLFLRQVTAPPTPVAVAAPTTVQTSAPTAAAQQTAPPQTLVPAVLTPASKATATPIPTPVPTRQPTAVSKPATQATAAPVAQPSEPSPLPTVPPELRREVETAYTQYWDARSQAEWTLDAAPLDDIATGEELQALRRDVDQLRAEGRAIKTEVQHQYAAIRVDGDEAQVLDRFRDFSIYVDAATKQPVPGEVRPSEADAPLNTVLYYMRREGTAWRVQRGERYAND